MRLWKISAMIPLLVLPLAAGPAIALPATPAAASSCAEFTFTNPNIGFPTQIPTSSLSEGSTGPCVAMLQQDLNIVDGANLAVDGQFGPHTLGAVEVYQENNAPCTGGADGIAGPYTMSCLDVDSSG